jgi:hypothetical protein
MNPDLKQTSEAQDGCCMTARATSESRYSIPQLQEKHRDIVTIHQHLLRQLSEVEVEERNLAQAIRSLVALQNR